MPEGPEVHLAAHFINGIAKNCLFAGKVEKSAVSTKNPDVPWDSAAYSIQATARGKELRLALTEERSAAVKKAAPGRLDILFHFGMSGKFEITERGKSHKHSHLKFFTRDGRRTLSFVDTRRFGRWALTDAWSAERGPCVLTEADLLPDHLAGLLDTPRLRRRPVCEALLDQRLFNGVGNYLRAEILHRAGVAPFEAADRVLEGLRLGARPALLRLAAEVPREVLAMAREVGGAPAYMGDAEAASGPQMAVFLAWLRCYGRDGMQTVTDSHGRTVWFSGPPGPLLPKGSRAKRQPAALKSRVRAAAGDANLEEEEEAEPGPKRRRTAAKAPPGSAVKRRASAAKEDGAGVKAEPVDVKREDAGPADEGSETSGAAPKQKRSGRRSEAIGSAVKRRASAAKGVGAGVKAEPVDVKQEPVDVKQEAVEAEQDAGPAYEGSETSGAAPKRKRSARRSETTAAPAGGHDLPAPGRARPRRSLRH